MNKGILQFTLAGLARNKLRTIFTCIALVSAFLLLGVFRPVEQFFSGVSDHAGAQRLMVVPKYSLLAGLPIAMRQKITEIGGVKEVAYAQWFPVTYQDNHSPSVFSVSNGYLKMYSSQYHISPVQLDQFMHDQDGMLIGQTLADKYGWKIGAVVPFRSQFVYKSDGSRDWAFKVDGIITGKQAHTATAFVHWSYINHASPIISNRVGWFVAGLESPKESSQVVKQIDAFYANSGNPTLTENEQEYVANLGRQVGNISYILNGIMLAVFFALLFVTGSTIAYMVREQRSEFAILKTIGFPDTSIFAIVIAQSIAIFAIGWIIGLGLATLLIPELNLLIGFTGYPIVLPSVGLGTWLVGGIIVVCACMVVGVAPAIRSMRLRIVDALADQ